jgi:hypothetical protein
VNGHVITQEERGEEKDKDRKHRSHIHDCWMEAEKAVLNDYLLFLHISFWMIANE